MKFKNEVQQKAHDYLFSRIQSATREVEEKVKKLNGKLKSKSA